MAGDLLRSSLVTYSHRNVVRAIAFGRATFGSVDGYVYEVLKEVSPDLVAPTEIARASNWKPFPPIALEQPGFFEPIRLAMESVRRLG